MQAGTTRIDVVLNDKSGAAAKRPVAQRIADSVLLRPQVEVFPLAQANEALARLKTGRLRGAAVLTMAQ